MAWHRRGDKPLSKPMIVLLKLLGLKCELVPDSNVGWPNQHWPNVGTVVPTLARPTSLSGVRDTRYFFTLLVGTCHDARLLHVIPYHIRPCYNEAQVTRIYCHIGLCKKQKQKNKKQNKNRWNLHTFSPTHTCLNIIKCNIWNTTSNWNLTESRSSSTCVVC